MKRLLGISFAIGLTSIAQADPLTDFQAAIKDAAVATPAEIVTDLNNISPDNPSLIWNEGRVRVVSWMSGGKLAATFPNGQNPGDLGAAPVKRDIWVTAVPQLREFCSSTGLTDDALELRLKQYIGLSPEWSYDALVEFYVAPEDLYRPCPDPGISDRACQLDNDPSDPLPSADDPEYRSWYEWMKGRSYGPDGAPWTRLGYTYDWGTSGAPVGGSEYVVTEGAELELAAIEPNPNRYCSTNQK